MLEETIRLNVMPKEITVERLLGKGQTPDSYLQKLLDSWSLGAVASGDTIDICNSFISLYPHPGNIIQKKLFGNSEFYLEIRKALAREYSKVLLAAGKPPGLLGRLGNILPSDNVGYWTESLGIDIKGFKDALAISNQICYERYLNDRELQNSMTLVEREEWLKAIGLPQTKIDDLLLFLTPFIKRQLDLIRGRKESG